MDFRREQTWPKGYLVIRAPKRLSRWPQVLRNLADEIEATQKKKEPKADAV
jgi:hypothetical protein